MISRECAVITSSSWFCRRQMLLEKCKFQSTWEWLVPTKFQ